MRYLAVVVLVSGCYLGVRGNVDTAVRARDTSAAAPGGALDLGLGGSDDLQSGQLMMSFGTSPLVARGDDMLAPRLPLAMFGGRYERAFTSAHPSVRWFTRVLLGGDTCTTTRDETSGMEEPTCTTPNRRNASVLSTALGVVLTATGTRDQDQMTPTTGSVGLAVVYTYADDEALGSGDFLGLELSLSAGFDFFGPLFSKEH